MGFSNLFQLKVKNVHGKGTLNPTKSGWHTGKEKHDL